MSIAVVIPTYNEKENIANLISAILSQKEKLNGHALQVVVGDSYSPDGTGEVVRELSRTNKNVYLIQDKRRGIGIGFLIGLSYAFEELKSNAVVCMDADFSHDPNDIPRLVAEFDEGSDVVIGSRYINDGGTKNWGLVRKTGSFIVNQYIRIMLGLKPKEITTNFRLFSHKVWEKLDKNAVPWTETSFLTTPALLYFVLKAIPEFEEIPIIFTDRTKGYSKAQLINYAWAIFKFSLKERKETLYTFFRFLSVGATGILINLMTLYLLVEKVNLREEFSSPVAVEASILSNFVLNNFWTFKKRSTGNLILHRLAKYNIISLLGLVITFGVFLLLTKVIGLHYLLAQFFGIALATSWTFIASMKWAWRIK